MELNILRADPAGNITVFVLDPVEKAQRAAIVCIRLLFLVQQFTF